MALNETCTQHGSGLEDVNSRGQDRPFERVAADEMIDENLIFHILLRSESKATIRKQFSQPRLCWKST